MIIMQEVLPKLCNNIQNVMLYDIPITWSSEQILIHLATWGSVLGMSIKMQWKYYIIQLKIMFNDFILAVFDRGKWCHRLHNLEVKWFPGHWTLKQRQNHSTFMAKVEGLPESVLADPFITQDFDKQYFFLRIKDLSPISFSSRNPIIIC
ncbi:hypothetical protein RclHR1_01730014 [Rhizophagus clarus]|nr:hypothetical protein RclHR1_01730014 [Rhizophagus clarus]